MDLLSQIPFQLLNKNAWVTKLLSACLLVLTTSITSQNAHAFDLDIDTANNQEKTSNTYSKWSYRNLINNNLVNGNLIKKIPSLLVFQTRDATYMVNVIKNQYLTFYKKKNKKLNATYYSGAYLLKYTHRW